MAGMQPTNVSMVVYVEASSGAHGAIAADAFAITLYAANMCRQSWLCDRLRAREADRINDGWSWNVWRFFFRGPPPLPALAFFPLNGWQARPVEGSSESAW
jgi:hypothetical protein